MNILFITSTLPRFADDGQAPFVLEQALAWRETYPADGVFVLAPHDVRAPLSETIGEVSITRFRYWWPVSQQKLAYPAILPNIRKNYLLILQLPALIISEFFATRRLIREYDIDFVFAHWVMPQGIVAWLAKRICGVPYGLHNHSSDLRVFAKIPLLGPPLARSIIRSSERLICQNSMLRDEAIGLFPEVERDAMKNKIANLTMGVFQGIDTQPNNGAGECRCDFAFIGRLSRKKGVDALLLALARLKEMGIPFRAQIAGSGEEEEALRASCRIPEVEFIGHASGDRKRRLFAESRFFIFPSAPAQGDVEGLPVAILEALYMGKIVVASKATNVELLPEWPELEGRVHLLADPESVAEFSGLLQKLLEMDSAQIDRVVAPTQAITARFGWRNRIGQYRQLLLGDLDPEA